MSVCEQVESEDFSWRKWFFFSELLRQEKHNSTFVKLLNEALVSNEVTLGCVFLNLTRAGIVGFSFRQHVEDGFYWYILKMMRRMMLMTMILWIDLGIYRWLGNLMYMMSDSLWRGLQQRKSSIFVIVVYWLHAHTFSNAAQIQFRDPAHDIACTVIFSGTGMVVKLLQSFNQPTHHLLRRAPRKKRSFFAGSVWLCQYGCVNWRKTSSLGLIGDII